MMTRVFKKLSLSLVLLAFVSACSPLKMTRNRSLGDHEVQQTIDSSEAKKSDELVFLNGMLLQIQPLVESQVGLQADQIDAKLLLDQVIHPLQERLLNTEYLLSVENRFLRAENGDFIYHRLIQLFNEAIVLVHAANEKLSKDLLLRYKHHILWDCDQRTPRSSCAMAKFYKSIDGPNISRIVKLILDAEENDLEKDHILRLAFDIKNNRLDASLRLMLLTRLAGVIDKEKRKELGILERRRNADLFANLLKINVKELMGDSPDYKNLIAMLEPWKLSRNIEDERNQAISEILRIAGKHLLYEKDGQLSSNLLTKSSNSRGQTQYQGVIADLRYVLGRDFEQGPLFQERNILGQWKPIFKKYQDTLRVNPGQELDGLSPVEKQLIPILSERYELRLFGDESANILQTLLKSARFKNSDMDEFFYLVHQTFFGHFNLEDAEAFWEQTRHQTQDNALKQERLLQEIYKILKRQMVNNIVYTNVRMNEFYNSRPNTQLIELLRQSDLEASSIRKVWTKTIIRANVMKNLISRVVNPGILTRDGLALFNEINNSVEAIGKNIKFLVTYPNMFPFMHIIASRDLEQSFEGFWGVIEIDSNTIINVFFEGNFMPWFNFGHNNTPLDSIEVLYTYYFTLVTQTLETYANSKVAPFSHKQFFEVVVKKLILTIQNEIDKKRQSLELVFDELQNSANAIEQICIEEKDLQARENELLTEAKNTEGKDFDWYESMRKVMQSRKKIVSNLDFSELPGRTTIYDPSIHSNDKPGKFIGEVYSSSTFTVFKSMHTQIQKKQLIAKTLVDIYKLTRNDEADAIQAIFEKQFADYNNFRAAFIKTFFEAEKRIRGCEWSVAQRDRDIRYMIIFQEAQELGKLFDAVWEIGKDMTEEERVNLEEGSPKSDQLQSALDRFNRYVIAPPHIAANPINLPSNYQARGGYNTLSLNSLSSYQMDMAVRIYGYINELFPGEFKITPPKDYTKEPFFEEKNPSISYFNWGKSKKEARQAFINAGITSLVKQIKWTSPKINTPAISNKREIIVNLFRMGPISKDPAVDCREENLDKGTFEKSCEKITARQLIDHFRKTIDWLNISDLDLKILNMLGKEHKYDVTHFERLIKKEDENDVFSYYDLLYKSVYSYASSINSESLWFAHDLETFVKSNQKLGGSTFIFPPNPAIDSVFPDKFKKWVDDYLATHLEFMTEIKKDVDLARWAQSVIPDQLNDEELEKYKRAPKPFKLRYRTDRHHIIGIETNDGSNSSEISLEPLISDITYGKFEGLLEKFNSDTKGFYSKTLDQAHKDLAPLVKPQTQQED